MWCGVQRACGMRAWCIDDGTRGPPLAGGLKGTTGGLNHVAIDGGGPPLAGGSEGTTQVRGES